MLSKYDELVDVKDEINKYICLLTDFKDLPNKNDIRCIVKYMLILKKITQHSQNQHYKKFMIYDFLMLMHSLTQNSLRNFYQLYRSFIENFIRSILDLADDDSTGVRELFKLVNEKFNSPYEVKEIINYIDGEYSKACNFVHSNIKANINVYTYYIDIIKSDEMNNTKLKSLISKVLTLVKKVTLFVIYVSPIIIDAAFYRRKQELKFLMGNKNYTIFEINLNKVTA